MLPLSGQTIEVQEAKLLFPESGAAGRLAEALLDLTHLCEWPTSPSGREAHHDLYYDGFGGAGNVEAVRLRSWSGGHSEWQFKRRIVTEGNALIYAVDREVPALAADAVPRFQVRTLGHGVSVATPTGPVSVRVRELAFSDAQREPLGQDIVIEVSAPPEVSHFCPVVNWLCRVFALVPTRRNTWVRGSRLLAARSRAPRPVFLDMDPGVDDALALLLALASPELTLCGLGVVAGNAPLARTIQNACTLLDLAREQLGREVLPPVYAGLTPPGAIPDATDVHGPDGLGGYSRVHGAPRTQPESAPAADALAQALLAAPGEVTVVATGPLTNLAACAQSHPEAFARARAIIVMGGAFATPGNRSPGAEFNIHRDPHAARGVLDAAERLKVPLTFVGLDVTHQVPLYRHDLEHAASPLAAALGQITGHYMDFYERNEGLPGCYLHDPLAVALAIDPGLCEVDRFHVQIETESPITAGATLADFRPTRLFANEAGRACEVARTVDAPRARRFILARLGLG